tara:strand:+ start:605 stop:772 length:168 start_codon:yes stop_codon:yes gene_type:complete
MPTGTVKANRGVKVKPYEQPKSNRKPHRVNRTGRVNKPANRDNQQKPVTTTDLSK